MIEGICNRQSFRAAARYQRVCQVCGSPGAWQPHHVVYEQVLRRIYGLRGNDLLNEHNSLRVCVACHARHHKPGVRKRSIKTVELQPQNITYAFQVMGIYAADWLRRYYDDAHPDPRILELESSYV